MRLRPNALRKHTARHFIFTERAARSHTRYEPNAVHVHVHARARAHTHTHILSLSLSLCVCVCVCVCVCRHIGLRRETPSVTLAPSAFTAALAW